MISAQQRLITTAVWIFVVLGGWSLAQHVALAEEKQVSGDEASSVGGHEAFSISRPGAVMRVEVKATGIPVLTQIPYFGRLFVTSSNQPEPDNCQIETNEVLERIGFDFDFFQKNMICSHGALIGCCVKCNESDNDVCPALGQMASTAQQLCKKCSDAGCMHTSAKCGIAAECPVHSNSIAHCAAAEPAKCADAEHCTAQVCDHHSAACHAQLAELTAENASLEAALEAKEELMELQSRMFEQVAVLMAEKAELQAELRFTEKLMEQRERKLHENHDLAVENLRLKSMLEAAAMHQAAEKERLELAFENERLKLKVAELERSHSSEAAKAQVAKEPQMERKLSLPLK